MNYWQIALVSIIGLIFGVLVEVSLESALDAFPRAKTGEKPLLRQGRRLAFGLCGAVVGVWATLAFTLESRLRGVEGYLDQRNVQYRELKSWLEGSGNYNRARAAIDGIAIPWLREKFADDIGREIDDALRAVSEDSTLKIRREAILPTWETLVEKSQQCFLATNLVPPSDWKNVARDGTGSRAQAAAHARGVQLARINLEDDRCPESFAELEKKQEAAGVLTFSLPREWIEENDYLDSLASELGTADLVLVDNAALLKTWVSTTDCKMKRAELSFRPRDLSQASLLFRRLMADAKEERDSSAGGPAKDHDYDAVLSACF